MKCKIKGEVNSLFIITAVIIVVREKTAYITCNADNFKASFSGINRKLGAFSLHPLLCKQ